jgi:hypothetical protein
MLALNHTLFGVIIAVTVKKPELVIPLSIASHFVLDVLPHFGDAESFGTLSKSYYPVLWVDGLAATTAGLIAIAVWPAMILVITLGIWSSIGPDLFWPFAKRTTKGSWAWKYFNFHKRIQLSETKAGIISEIAWFAFFTGTLYSLALTI